MSRESQVISFNISSINEMISSGRYLDAYHYFKDANIEIESLGIAEKNLVIRTSYHLGGERSSDALLLSEYRKNRQSPELVERMFYYYLNTRGPLLSYEFMQANEALFASKPHLKAKLNTFKSILYREWRDFSRAEYFLNEAIKDQALSQDSTDGLWLKSLQCRLLLAQELNDEALKMAKENFSEQANVTNLQTYVAVLQKVEDMSSAISVLENHVNDFQSCILWLQLASMSASELQWQKCEYAVEQFMAIQQFEDKYFAQSMLAYKGQIALYKEQYEQAEALLQGHKAPYWKLVTENLKKRPSNAKIVRLDVPFYRQEHLTCAPTTLAAIANYYGRTYSSKEIADQICFSGTPSTKEREWLKENDFHFVEFDLNQEYLIQLIDLGVPFGLVTTSGFSAHLQAVIGYNSHLGTMFIMDPSSAGLQEMLVEQTIKLEAFRGARCIAIVPTEDKQKLAGFAPSESILYELYDDFLIAEEKNDIEGANLVLEKLVANAPDHRITLSSKRSFELWQGNYAKVQTYNRQLLKQFPTQSILLSSQFFCLRDLGERQNAIDSLEQYLDKHLDIDLVRILFEQIRDTNEKPQLLQKLLTYLKRYCGYQADIYQALAHYYWDMNERDKATELYLLSYCLDDTNNHHVENYFKASRHLNQEHVAIQFLTQRYEKYAKRSPMPAICLFDVYELSNQEHIGFEYLEKALQLHPSAPDLLIKLGRKYIHYGMATLFQEKSELFKKGIPHKEYLTLEAELAVAQGELEKVKQFYATEFSQSPFIKKDAEAYFAVLRKMEKGAELDEILRKLYQQHPANSIVHDYVIEWHSDEKFQKQILLEAIKARPDNGTLRRRLIDKLIRMGQSEEALKQAQETLRILPTENINGAFLAKAYIASGQFEQAKASAKSVLAQEVDNDLAIDILIQASISIDEKIESLAFFFEQMQSQVVLGDSAWYYWFEAKSILPREELSRFIAFVKTELSHLWYCHSLVGYHHQQNAELDQAIESYKKGIEQFPFTPRLHADLASAWALVGEKEKAIASYRNVLELNPGWSKMAIQLVDIFEGAGRIDEAIDVLQQTVKHNVDDGILYGYLADFQLKKEQYDAALESLKKAIECDSNYDWAWTQIVTIGRHFNNTKLAYEIALDFSQKYSYLSQSWVNLANQCDNFDDRLAYYRKAIAINPMNQTAHISLAYLFDASSDIKSALAVFEETPWQQHLPFELFVAQSDILMRSGKDKEAIDALFSALSNVSGHSHLWERLYDWMDKYSSPQSITEACYKQVELNRTDATQLLIASNKLLNCGNDGQKADAKEFLVQANQYSPDNQYVMLTLADVLLEDEKPQQALAILQAYRKTKVLHFALAREVFALLKLEQEAEAIATYDLLIQQPDPMPWSIVEPFKALVESIGFAKAIKLLEQRVTQSSIDQNEEPCSEEIASIWSEQLLLMWGFDRRKDIIKKAEDSAKNNGNSDILVGALKGLYQAWLNSDRRVDSHLLKKYIGPSTSKNSVFEKYADLLLKSGAYTALTYAYEKAEDTTIFSMFAHYQVRAAYQLIDKWDEAADVIRVGVLKEPDFIVHNMRLWQVFEQWRVESAINTNLFYSIDTQELTEPEQYVHATMRVALIAGDNSLEDCLNEITPALRDCQHLNQNAGGLNLTLVAQKILRQHLAARITSQGWFARQVMKWKLSNRF